MRFSAVHTFRLCFFRLPALFGMVLSCTLDAPWVFVTVPLWVPVCLALLTLWYQLRFSMGLYFHLTAQNISNLIYLVCVFISTERQYKHIKRFLTSPFKCTHSIYSFVSSCMGIADYSARVTRMVKIPCHNSDRSGMPIFVAVPSTSSFLQYVCHHSVYFCVGYTDFNAAFFHQLCIQFTCRYMLGYLIIKLIIYEGNSISKLQIQVATYVFELSAGNCHR